jgi:hypothetical protein
MAGTLSGVSEYITGASIRLEVRQDQHTADHGQPPHLHGISDAREEDNAMHPQMPTISLVVT